jgi:uncharacterized protein YuzE
MTLMIQYSPDVDFLTLWNGVQSGGGEDVAAGLTVFFDKTDTSVVSFTVESAVRELTPILFGVEATLGTVRSKVEQKGYLEDTPLLIEYNPVSDTLRLWNGREVSDQQSVADSLAADFDGSGEVIGFTLKRATAQLKPFLQRGQPPREFALSA